MVSPTLSRFFRASSHLSSQRASAVPGKRVVFSGMQPTGVPTLGNYLGAVQNWSNLQGQGWEESLYCIVDMHAITTPSEQYNLREKTVQLYAVLLASGLCPDENIIFQQSKVPYHAHLGWMFGCVTPLGWLNRMTQFKVKSGNQRDNSSSGLYTYPVLQAADILLYHGTHVPVGEDQIQHIELARDIATAFNARFAEDFFVPPQPLITTGTARVMSLRDGTSKMSKSDKSDMSRINMTDSADEIRKKIQKAKTDALGELYFDKEGRPEVSNLLSISAKITGKTVEDICGEYAGRPSVMASFKKDLTEQLVDFVCPIGDEINRLMDGERGELERKLDQGSDRALAIAQGTMDDLHKAMGMM